MKFDKGVKLALITALVSGVSIFINKFAVGVITPPLVFTGVKNSLVAILIISLILFSRKWKQLTKLDKGQLSKLALIGIIGGALPFYLFFTGLSQISAINGALIHKTLVLWVIVLAVPFLKEKLSTWQGLAVLILFVSNLLVGGFKGFAFSVGELFVLMATLLWAVENIIAKKVLSDVDIDLVVAARMGLGAIILMTVALFVYPQNLPQMLSLSLSQSLWMLATAIALLAYVMTWYRALKFAPVITVATILVSATLVTNLLSAIFITGTWNLKMLWQAGMIVLGLGIFLWGGKGSILKDKAVA